MSLYVLSRTLARVVQAELLQLLALMFRKAEANQDEVILPLIIDSGGMWPSESNSLWIVANGVNDLFGDAAKYSSSPLPFIAVRETM